MSLDRLILFGSWSLFCVALGWLVSIVMSAQGYTPLPTPTPTPEPEPEPARAMPEPVMLRPDVTMLEIFDISKRDEPYRNRLLQFARHNRASAFDGVDDYQGDSGDEQAC